MHAAGRTDLDALASGLTAILHAATGRDTALAGTPAESASIAVPLRGSGADVPDLFADLAVDLLAQVEVHGAGLDQVRLDGLLRTDDGLMAWGYALGTPGDGAPPLVAIVGSPVWEDAGGEIVLRFVLHRTI